MLLTETKKTGSHLIGIKWSFLTDSHKDFSHQKEFSDNIMKIIEF